MSQTRQRRAESSLCGKCGGFVVVERVLDFYGRTSGSKCVNCGWCRRDNEPPQPMEDHMSNRGTYK
ncbi:MAG: hypothetical protein ABIR36_08725 [Nitrospiraceae bacterium]